MSLENKIIGTGDIPYLSSATEGVAFNTSTLGRAKSGPARVLEVRFPSHNKKA